MSVFASCFWSMVRVATPFLLLVGCASAPDTTLIHVSPPLNWEEQLRSARETKDDWLRGSEETPILPQDLETFEGLQYYDADPSYYLVGRVWFYESPQPLEMPTTGGKIRPAERVGWISFELEGRPLRLEVYRLLDNQQSKMFLPFADATSGSETYPAGRYIELNGSPTGPWVLDFNHAYNPSCAYGEPERFACPVTPRENRLDVTIRAGERGFHAEDGDGSAG